MFCGNIELYLSRRNGESKRKFRLFLRQKKQTPTVKSRTVRYIVQRKGGNMRIIKRSGEEELFDIRKIEAAIKKANSSVSESERANDTERELVARRVEEIADTCGHAMGIEDIQDAVIVELMKLKRLSQCAARLYGRRSKQRYYQEIPSAAGYCGRA